MCPSRVRRRCLCRRGREELFTDLADDASFASQDEPLLRGGEDGGGDAQERVRGSRAPELEAPQVGRPVASLWFIVVHADDGFCQPHGPEIPNQPPPEPFEGRRGELLRHRGCQVDLELEVVHLTQRVAGAR